MNELLSTIDITSQLRFVKKRHMRVDAAALSELQHLVSLVLFGFHIFEIMIRLFIESNSTI